MSTLDELAVVVDALAVLDAQRARMVAERNRLIAAQRAEGWSFGRLAQVSGMTSMAVLKMLRRMDEAS